MLAKACFAISCDTESNRIYFFSSRGYHIYQSIWSNPSRDDELADVRMGSRLEMLSLGLAGVLATVQHISKISKVRSIFIAWWYELTFISSSSYSMCSCDHLKSKIIGEKNFGKLNAIRQSFLLPKFFTIQ